ncbi:Tat pathway signal protein [Bradyrhizobium sp.]|uniref:Acg family FMN-binding oxidoreductase n=1 Tax=Bradyrhizobium sp. TaxID=376 RepID=UPI0025C475FD|nr:Tat pathway signal protein [Bradyrhizobium sp.]
MNRRAVLIGGAAAVGVIVPAGIGGVALWARQDIDAWRDAVAAIRRPLVPGLSGRAVLTELVRCATLAANSHNTQAWRFALGESAITLVPDFARRTPVVDPDDHHLFASLGAAVENIVQAAPIFGLAATPHFDAGGDGRVVIELRAGDSAVSEMAAAIVKRQCTRAVYDGRTVPASDLRTLAAAGSSEGVDVVLLTERPAIDAVAALIIDGNTSQLREPAFRSELQHWLRFSYAAALSTGDGLFAPTTGNPALPDPVGRMLFDLVVSADSENSKCLAQIASSAGLAVFVSGRSDRPHWIASGRAYQRFALQATALGIKHAFLNQAVEVPQVRQRLAEHLALGERRPDLIVRFGYADAMPFSLRRPASAVPM